jgi:hypothetical protein
MKWIIPKDGQERVRKTFLWFPTEARVYDEKKKEFLPLVENRWLQYAVVRETYLRHYYCWVIQCFIENDYTQPTE